ncbi:helix-turn-helix transcriptional regulator, partial [Streptomyces sp. NPDC051639]|uniref:PadR family transcriptional regulator n=1 Tax=Streptomyces sp. NPDC051639 TaxID=3155671 RepID=UPI00343FAC17
MTTSAPRSSPLALTVLALLHYKPLHPYGIQRLVKDWGKEQVVNVRQRASLYRTIERLNGDGLITVRETGRDQQYPERTVYEVTDAGRETARAWLEEMLSAPKEEFPEFPAALSTFSDEYRIRRYGFHGTSHAYVSRETAKLLG